MFLWRTEIKFPETRLFLQVTADINILQASAAKVIVTVFCVGGFARTLVGPLPFWLCVTWVEAMKWSVAFLFAVTNVSAFLQISLIIDLRYLLNFPVLEF